MLKNECNRANAFQVSSHVKYMLSSYPVQLMPYSALIAKPHFVRRPSFG